MSALLLVWYVLSTLSVGFVGACVIGIAAAEPLDDYITRAVKDLKERNPAIDTDSKSGTLAIFFFAMFWTFSSSLYTIVFSLAAIAFGCT